MTRRDHALLTALAAAAALATLFQCWYMALPAEEAVKVDWCRFSRRIDCFETLHHHGPRLYAWIVPVFPALLGLLWFQLALCGFAWVAGPAAREAWIALARLVSFPASGLAVYVLVRDYGNARATGMSALTSASTLVVMGCCLAVNVITVLRGLQGARLRAGAGGALVFALGAALFGTLVHGAGSARRELTRAQQEAALLPPAVRWPAFARTLPRADAASLGNPDADAEVLLFLDDLSSPLLAEALALQAEYGDRVRLYLYAPGDLGARLVAAQRAGRLREYLQGGGAPETGAADAAEVARQERAWRELGVTEYPSALWDGGRRTKDFTLRAVFAAALGEQG